MGRLRLWDIDGHPIDVALPSTATVGRAVGSDIRVEHDSVSRAHALIAWDGAAWTIRDLASQNGTFLGERRLDPGIEDVLRQGTKLGFGDVDAELIDASGPRPIAIADSQVVEAEGAVLWLETDGQLTIVHYADGCWMLESEAGQTPVVDGQKVRIGTTQFVLRLPEAMGATHPTRTAFTLDDLHLRVCASADYETIRVVASLPNGEHDLGTRAHHGLVWLLAHHRRVDHDAGTPAAERGWVDATTLPRLAATSENTLYTYVHRFRKQIADLGVVDAPSVIERRPQGGQVRLSVTCSITALTEAGPR